MQTSILMALLAVLNAPGASISEKQIERQDEYFQKYWGTDFEWKFDALPAEGTVPSYRVPYSGYIYPDTGGGTQSMLQKYDRAFNGGRYLATSHERWDTTAYAKPVSRRGGFLGLRMTTVMETPHWHGHCNGWAASAIRHAEPQTNVTRNGVVFTPADIKGLLAEIYIYNDIIELAGSDYALNAGVFHAVLANWIGRGSHPLGMEADPGEEKWNYPIYGYATSSAKRSDTQVEVKMNIAYAKDSNGEFQQSPRYQRTKYFHYMLNLDSDGRIVGGYFLRDSSMIDLLWMPLRPKQGRREGNERGNPYVDVDKVLALWRDSVPEETRQKWPIIDPPAEDRISDTTQLAGLVPVQDPTLALAHNDAATPEETAEPVADTSETEDTPAAAPPATETEESGEATPVETSPQPPAATDGESEAANEAA
ncbi:MAG: hypothetical protein JJ992_24180 [Planctomycetes bacterium]|nr:hypothetical protein [Planctomycetota bacterium]